MNQEVKRIPDTAESLNQRFLVLQGRVHDARKASFTRKPEAIDEATTALLLLLQQTLTEMVDLRRDVDFLKQQFHAFLKREDVDL